MSDLLKIGLIGQVSAGKSTFLNALAGDFIGNVSLLRETFHPEVWMFNQKQSDNIQKIYEWNKQIAEKNKQIRKGEIKLKDNQTISRGYFQSLLLNRDFIITDFPGINDAWDDDGHFFELIEGHAESIDIFIFLTSANTAFTLKDEAEAFNRIRDIVKRQNENGIWSELLVLINKYDFPEDDVDELIDLAKQKIQHDKVFRISSYQLFCYHLHLLNKEYYPPESSKKEFAKIVRFSGARHKNGWIDIDDSVISDHDNLLDYLQALVITEKKRETIMKCVIGNDLADPDKTDYVIDMLNLLKDIYPMFYQDDRFIEWFEDSEKNVLDESDAGDAMMYLIHFLGSNKSFDLLERITTLCLRILAQITIIKHGGKSDLNTLISILGYNDAYSARMDIMLLFFPLEHLVDTACGGKCGHSTSTLEVIYGLPSEDPIVKYVQNLIRISWICIKDINLVHSMYPDYYKRYFYMTKYLYPRFLQLRLCKDDKEVMHNRLFQPINELLGLIGDDTIDSLSKEYGYI